MPGKRILLVDYDPKILNHTREVLEGAGFSVSTCVDGLAALDQFKVLSPDLVLLSAMLPKMHGFEVCSNIRKLPGGEKTPVVLITDVYKGKRYRVDAINKYGATEYIERPIEDNGLITVLKELVKDDLGFIRSSEHLDEKTVQFTTDMFSHMVKEVPIGGEKKLGEKKNVNEKPKSTDVINKKLEESLAGLELEVSKKAKAKSKTFDSSATEEKSAGASDSTGFTSEDLFTDVIASVERELQSEKVFEHIESSPEGIVIPEAPPVMEQKTAAPEPPPPAPKPPAPKPAAVKSTDKKFSFDDEIEKKLSSTLSGLVKDKSSKAAAALKQTLPKAPSRPQPPKVEAAVAPVQAPAAMKPVTAPLVSAVPAPAAKPETKPEPFTAKTPAPAVAVKEGVDFGQYLLLGKVATGGMAELFKAKRKGPEGFEKILAIKRILPHMSDNEDFVTMFIDEAKLAARLTHHNICQIFDLGKIDNSYYIAMEFVHGRDLRAALRAARSKNVTFPVEIAVLITSKIASALDYAHRKRSADGQPLNLVHRDVSPQNILISYEGEVKLVDFGIAKAATKAHQTQHGALKGKLLYMSPEQAWGRNVDKRSDLFSLGAILYEMLTGHPLFFSENDTEVTILEKVREAKITPVRELNSRAPAELEKITTKALRKNPDDRYQQASEMQADLDKLFYSEAYNATSASLATFIRSLFPDDWAKEGGSRDAVEKEPVEKAPVAAIAEGPARPVPEKPSAPSPVQPHAAKEPARDKEGPRREKETPVLPKAEPVAPKIEAPSKPSGFRDITAPEIMVAAQPKKSSKTLLLGLIGAVIVAIVLYFLFRPKAEEPVARTPVVKQKTAQPVAIETDTSKVSQPAAPAVTPPPLAQDQKQENDLKEQEAEAKKLAEQQAAEEAKKKEEERKKQEQAKLEEEQRLAQAKAEQERLQREAEAKAEAEPEQEPEQVAQVQPPPVQEQRQQPEPVKEAPKPQAAPPQQSSVKEGDLVEVGAGVVKPELTKQVNPEYPPAALKKKIEGTVIISVLVSETGNVTDVKVLRQAGGAIGLNEAAVAAARKWKFKPAVKDGKRVKVWVTYPIVFKIH